MPVAASGKVDSKPTLLFFMSPPKNHPPRQVLTTMIATINASMLVS